MINKNVLKAKKLDAMRASKYSGGTAGDLPDTPPKLPKMGSGGSLNGRPQNATGAISQAISTMKKKKLRDKLASQVQKPAPTQPAPTNPTMESAQRVSTELMKTAAQMKLRNGARNIPRQPAKKF